MAMDACCPELNPGAPAHRWSCSRPARASPRASLHRKQERSSATSARCGQDGLARPSEPWWRFRCLVATRGGAMPPCDAHRAQGRPTCGRTGGGGVSAVSSVAFGAVRSTTPEKGLERHPEQAWAASRYPTATRGVSTPPEGGCGSHGRPAASRGRGSGHLSSRLADLRSGHAV